VITNQVGQAVWRYDNTDPFGGNVPDENPSGLGAFEFPLRDEGTYFDKETGLAYNWNRYRDLRSGRFIQADPLGLDGGDLSLYVLRKNNPLSFTDPQGLVGQGAAAACGPYMLACAAVITGAMYYSANVTGIKGKSGAANDPCYYDPCERRQEILLKWYTKLITGMAASQHVAWNVYLIKEAHRYNRNAEQQNAICPKNQVPYIGVSPYFDVIPGGQPPNLSDFYLKGP